METVVSFRDNVVVLSGLYVCQQKVFNLGISFINSITRASLTSLIRYIK